MKHEKIITGDVIIKGYYELLLHVGSKYEIHYGIHQGVYEYVGQEVNRDYDGDLHNGAHLFKNIETGVVSFGYYGANSPFEFTNIVRPITT